MVEHGARRPLAPVGERGDGTLVRGIGEIPRRRIAAGAPRSFVPLVILTISLGGLAGCDRTGTGGRAQAPAVESPRGGASNGPVEGPTGSSPRGSGSSNSVPAASTEGMPGGADGDRIELGPEVEPWLLAALESLAAAGRLDLDLPVAMHLPLLASPRADFITPRQLMDHTAHLGARAYEDFLRANPGSHALKAQAFLVALGSDDTPGERPAWRRAHLDLMGWLILELTGAHGLADGLNVVLGKAGGGLLPPEARPASSEATSPVTPIRARVSVSRTAHDAVAQRHSREIPGRKE